MKTSTATTLVYLFLLSVIVGGVLVVPTAIASTLSAEVTIKPDKINLLDLPDPWDPPILAEIRFPKPDRDKVEDINFSTVLLDGTIPAYDEERTKFTYKAFFYRTLVVAYLWLKLYHMGYTAPFKNVKVELEVTGYLYDGSYFKGSDTILVSAK